MRENPSKEREQASERASERDRETERNKECSLRIEINVATLP